MSVHAAAAQPPLDQDLVRKLKAAARAGRSMGAAQVQLINLDDIVSRSGKHWPAVNDRIRSGSLAFIRGCINDDDLAIACDDGFLIVFAEADAEVLARRAREMQELLVEFYYGQEGLEALNVNVQRRNLDPDSFQELIEARPPSSSKAQSTPAPDHDIVFRPVWAAQAEIIACYFCAPTFCEQGVIRPGYDPGFRQDGRGDGPSFAELDVSILRTASDALTRLLARRACSVVGATVHVTTLRRRKSMGAYLQALGEIPEPTRKRMVIKIAEIEPGTPVANLVEWASLLRQHVRHIALDFHHSDRAVDRLRLIAAWSAGFELPQHACDATPAARRSLATLIELWARATRSAGMRLQIGGWRDPALLTAARAAGVELACSEIAWPSQRAPMGVVKATAPQPHAVTLIREGSSP